MNPDASHFPERQIGSRKEFLAVPVSEINLLPVKIHIILHGKKRGSQRLLSELTELRPDGIDYTLSVTEKPGDTVRLSASHAATCDLLVVAGGDGTLHECINGLMSARDATPGLQLPAVALLPLGTGNDYARNFGWKKNDPGHLFERIRNSNFVFTDIGQIDHSAGTTYFINCADVGLGAHVVEIAERMKSAWPSGLVFPIAILRGLISYRKKEVDIAGKNFGMSGPNLTTVVSLGKYFGDGIQIAPGAMVNDGKFRVAWFGKVALTHYLRYLPDLRKGHTIEHPEVVYHVCDTLEMKGNGSIEADGEPVADLPARFTVLPAAIRILL
jgi:diacylglycerol kinase (ATP)